MYKGAAVSKTTQGGADFELLCTGSIRNYSFNPADLSGQREAEGIKKKLIAQLEDTVRELELHCLEVLANSLAHHDLYYSKYNAVYVDITYQLVNLIPCSFCEHKIHLAIAGSSSSSLS